MATWVDPIDSQTDPDAPLTSELGKRWDNNVVSFVEQDSTSPVNEAAYYPYDKVTVGDSNDGLVYDGAVDGVMTTITTPDLDAGYRYLIEWQNLDAVGGPTTLTVNYYNSSDALIASSTHGSVGAGTKSTGSDAAMSSDYWRGKGASGSAVTVPSVVDYMTITGTNFNQGKVYLRRRKELI